MGDVDDGPAREAKKETRHRNVVSSDRIENQFNGIGEHVVGLLEAYRVKIHILHGSGMYRKHVSDACHED